MGEKSMRLDRLLGNMGVGTRKDIKEMARHGRILVNGSPVRDTSQHVTPSTDLVEVDGEQVIYREHIYLMMNKPAGLVSATEDVREETVVSLLEPEDQAFNPFPVGRLDKDTEGLLILTNDGQLSHELLSPKRHVPKTYYAEVLGEVTQFDADAFLGGVTLDDGYRCLPGHLTVLKTEGAFSHIELTIFEGKFHQVKRMFESVGKKVSYLRRIRMGALELDDDLPTGTYRELTEEELQLLRER